MEKITFGVGYDSRLDEFKNSLQILDLTDFKQTSFFKSDEIVTKMVSLRRYKTINGKSPILEAYKLSSRMPELAKKEKMLWIEVIVDAYVADDNLIFFKGYLGGRILNTLGSVRPVGVVSTKTLELYLRLEEIIKMQRQSEKELIQLDSKSKSLGLDGFSSGILFHELVGHMAESDVISRTNQNFFSKRIVRNIEVSDVPFWGQNKDDFGNKVTKQNILSGKLSDSTGNAFISFSPRRQKMIKLIRQRKLEARALKVEGTNKPDAQIVSGQILSLRQKVLFDIAATNFRKPIRLAIPIESVQSISATSKVVRSYASICMKDGIPTVVGLSAPACVVELDSPLQSFIVRKGE